MTSPGRVLFAASLGFFVVILDVTIVNVALPSIGDDLGADLSELQWVIDGYVVAFAALLLSSGALGDRIGVARCLLGRDDRLHARLARLRRRPVARRAARRAGRSRAPRRRCSSPPRWRSSGSPTTTPATRAKGIATWAATGGIALAAGPVVGGVLTSAVDWRAIFFLNLPVGVIAVLANVHGPRSPRKRTPLDLPGQAAAIVAIGALTFGVIEAGHEGLDSAPALAAFAVFAVAAVAFVAIEGQVAHPAVPPDLFRTRMVATTVVGGLLLNFAFYGQVFVLSLFFQQVLGHNALISGLMFLPLTALIAAVNILSGRLTSRHGPRSPLIVGQADL